MDYRRRSSVFFQPREPDGAKPSSDWFEVFLLLNWSLTKAIEHSQSSYLLIARIDSYFSKKELELFSSNDLSLFSSNDLSLFSSNDLSLFSSNDLSLISSNDLSLFSSNDHSALIRQQVGWYDDIRNLCWLFDV